MEESSVDAIDDVMSCRAECSQKNKKISVSKETLLERTNESKVVRDTNSGNKFLKEFSKDSTRIANDSFSSMLSKIKSVDIYKLLLAHYITYYKGRSYCYLCKLHFKNFVKAKYHIEETHRNISINVSDFLNIVDEFSDIDYEQFLDQGIIIEGRNRYFCVHCHYTTHTLNSIIRHIKKKEHQEYRDTILPDTESDLENLNDDTSSMQSDVSIDKETSSMEYVNESESVIKTQTMYENKLSKDRPCDTLVVNKMINKNNSKFYSMSQINDMYKYLMALCIICHKEQWYCYLCKLFLENLVEVKRHLENFHANLRHEIANSFDLIELSDVECKKFLEHGIIIKDVPNLYFCAYCENPLEMPDIRSHIKEKRHLKAIISASIRERTIDDFPNLNSNANGKEKNVDIQTSIEYINNSESLTEIQKICDNYLKNFKNNSTHLQVKNKIVKSNSTDDLKSSINNFTYLYKRFMAQRIMCYYEQWYCYLCDCMLLNFAEATNHSEKVHPDVQMSDFSKDFISLSNKKSKLFFKHGIVIKELPNYYFCIYCQCSIYNLYNIKSHLKKVKHKNCINIVQDIKSIEQIDLYSNTSNKHDSVSDKDDAEDLMNDIKERVELLSTTKVQIMTDEKYINDSCSFNKVVDLLYPDIQFINISIYKFFLIQRITCYNKQWYCYLCKCILQNVKMKHHLQENHSDINQMSEFFEILADLSDLRCHELLKNAIVIKDIQTFFCVSCQCSMLSLYHIDEHVRGNRHKKYIKNMLKSPKNILKNSYNGTSIKQNDVFDTQEATQYFNKPEFSANSQTVFENKLANNLSYNTKKNTSLCNSNKGNNKNDNILDIKNTIDTLFCSLCDVFIYNEISMKEHMSNKQHVTLEIKFFFQQTMYIIELETIRKMIRPLQLNNGQLDDPNKYPAFIGTFTCDKCDGIIKEHNLVNHEIIQHKNDIKFSNLSDADNQSLIFKIKLLVHIYNSRFKSYPMFKCSFCNEIIHGILALQNHFSKHRHRENMIKLAEIRKQEYNSFSKRVYCMEPIEFLSTISLNDNETLQAMEQPVIYVKTHSMYYIKPKYFGKEFIYFCAICQCIFHHAQHIIMHFKKKREHHFENILSTYNLLYRDMYLTPTFQSKVVTSPVHITANMLINSEIELKESIENEMRLVRQVNNHDIVTNIDSNDTRIQEVNNHSIVTNIDSKNDTRIQEVSNHSIATNIDSKDDTRIYEINNYDIATNIDSKDDTRILEINNHDIATNIDSKNDTRIQEVSNHSIATNIDSKDDTRILEINNHDIATNIDSKNDTRIQKISNHNIATNIDSKDDTRILEINNHNIATNIDSKNDTRIQEVSNHSIAINIDSKDDTRILEINNHDIATNIDSKNDTRIQEVSNHSIATNIDSKDDTRIYEINNHDIATNIDSKDDTRILEINNHDIATNIDSKDDTKIYEINKHDIATNIDSKDDTRILEINNHDIATNIDSKNDTRIQKVNNHNIATNIDSKDDTRIHKVINDDIVMKIHPKRDTRIQGLKMKNKEKFKRKSFFTPSDISANINELMENESKNFKYNFVHVPLDNISEVKILDQINRVYQKKYLQLEEIIFICHEKILKEIKLGMLFYVPYSDKSFRCLVCSATDLYNVHILVEHARSITHVTRLKALMNMMNSTKVERLKELINELDATHIKCYACNEDLSQSQLITTHIQSPSHKTKRENLLTQMMRIVKEFETLWYNIKYFACVPCNFRFETKIIFMEHLERHTPIEDIKDNSMFDFCLTCATLWYGEKLDIYNEHCVKAVHQYLLKTNDFAINPLPQAMQKLLKNINETVVQLSKKAKKILKDPRRNQLKNELNHVFKVYRLPIEICIVGSRITGLALPTSDIDIYLNFGNECTDIEVIEKRNKQIQACFRENDNWLIETIVDRSWYPMIKLKHLLTGLYCNLSFTNGLPIENTNLIRSFNMAYPPCKKLTLFLKKWMLLGGLNDLEAITHYALTWLVIFYLQVKYKIPSVADLIKSHNESKIVGGWETGIGNIIPIDVPELPIHELLLGFFQYYGKFDYMHCVVCPLLGEICYKKSFSEETNLPKAMTLYVSQMSSTENAEYFRNDSPMCVQDPFDLSHNLTKDVPILILRRFKHYCNESASLLHDITLKKGSSKNL